MKQRRAAPCVYRLVFANGKTYVGSTVSLVKRLSAYRAAVKRGRSWAVLNAWRKHGEPRVEVLESIEQEKDLRSAEQRWLNLLRPFANEKRGYNMSHTAASPDADLIRSSALSQWRNAEHRENMARHLSARWADDTNRVKMSERSRAMWADPEAREKCRAAHADPDVRRRMSEAAKARWSDPAYKARMLAAQAAGRKAKPLTTAQRLRKSETTRAVMARPGARERISEKVSRRTRNPDGTLAKGRDRGD